MSPTLILTFILFFAGIALLWLFVQLLEARKRANPDSPASIDEDSGIVFANYLPRDSLLRPGERAFFPTLRQACADRSLIFTQVQLSKLIYPRAGIPKRQTYQNKIDRKSVDFVLCHPSTLKPQLIIELDDKSHTREDRKTRDDFVNNALKAAGIPLLRVTAAASYNISDLESQIRALIRVGT